MPDLRDKRVELILQQLEALPTLPAVAVRVLQVTGDDTSSAADVVRLIGSDPALTSRILQLTRRADRGVRDEVTTVDRAVVLLGFEAVRNAVLAVSVFQALGGPPGGDGGTGGAPSTDQSRRFDREGFWTHSLAVACCAELLAESGGGAAGRAGVSPAEAFLCGLLHDLGKLALDVALPKSYAKVVEAADLLRGDIADLERAAIGVDHQVAGKRLAERWQLPAAVRDAAWLHGQPPGALPSSSPSPSSPTALPVHARTVNLVTLADLLVRQQHLGYSGNYAFPVDRDALAAAVGLSTVDVDRAVAQLVRRMEPRSAALGLGRATGDDLYRQALAQANRELARVGGQLAAKTKRVAQRAKFFDALRQFHEALRADATVQQTLSAVASTAAAFVGVEADRTSAFSLSPGKDYAEAVRCDADGSVAEAAVVELPGMGDLTAGDGGVTEAELRAAQDLARASGAASGVFPATVAAVASSAARATTTFPPAMMRDASESPAVVPSPLAVSRRDAPADVGIAKPQAGTSTDPAHSPATSTTPVDNPVLPAGDDVALFAPFADARLPDPPDVERFWVCLQADGACIGGVIWTAPAGEPDRLTPQAQELSALAHGWSLALRAAQAREDARALAEGLAAANRRLTAAQDVLLRTRSLTTVGEMAAGAAHEMNNPLAVISGRSQLLAGQLSDPKQKAAATLVYEQADRLSGIITDLMAFAKPQPPRARAAEVGHLVSMAVSRAKQASIPADRTGDAEPGEARAVEVAVVDTPLVGVDAEQVADALAEVIANALQATAAADGAAAGGRAAAGRVSVRAGHDPWSGQVVIVVADDGPGMDEATLSRAFDPFFSGQRAGRRRGLGLSKALRWVEASGGTIRLDSRPGAGTRAAVLLPVAAADLPRADVGDSAGAGDRAGPGGAVDEAGGDGGSADGIDAPARTAGTDSPRGDPRQAGRSHGNGTGNSGPRKRPTEGGAARAAE